MREIKFRAWDKINDAFINGFNMIGFSKGQGAPQRKLQRYSSYWDAEDVELMQYTGLKDKNGKEIYEGDIVEWGDKLSREHGNSEIVTVIWSGGAFCVRDKRDQLYEFFHYFSHRWNDMPYVDEDEKMDIVQYFRNTFEVIGNIYENAELLTQSSIS